MATTISPGFQLEIQSDVRRGASSFLPAVGLHMLSAPKDVIEQALRQSTGEYRWGPCGTKLRTSTHRLVASLGPMLAVTAVGRTRTPGLEPDLEIKGRGGGGESARRVLAGRLATKHLYRPMGVQWYGWGYYTGY